MLLDDSASGGAVTELWTSRNASSAWFSVADKTASDGACLRSGAISSSETTSVETTLVGPGTLSFKWKVPAGRGDYARVYLDDVEQATINRKTEWQTASLDIPAGEHVVRWSYERGSGSATGEDAAFLDDVDWRPQVSLAVSSAFGAASPAAGAHTLVYGDEVAASVATPEPADGTRRVCTGWTGTGSVPAMGIGTNVSFRIEEDSTLSWNWRTDHWIDVAVSGGTADFASQWIEAGTQVAVTVVPVTHLYKIAFAGDTNGVSLAGTTLTILADGPREIAVTVEEVKVSLAVESEWGVPSPTNGVHSLSWGTEIKANASEPEPADGFRCVCTGWSGTGSVPSNGTDTNVAFRIEENSSVVWNWKTNVWIELSTSGPLEADFVQGWIDQGSNVVVSWTPMVPYFTIALTGDTSGSFLDENARTLAIPADRPRFVTLAAKELTLAGALDGPGLCWTTDGAATWFPQIAETHDTKAAAKSGSVLGDETSALEVALNGDGTFAWSWRIDAAGNAGVDVLLDGEWIEGFAPSAEWTHRTLEITGDRPHTVRFEFWNEGTEATISDCAWLDAVTWEPAEAETPWIAGDDGTAVEGDGTAGWVVRPGAGNTAVEVVVPHGTDPAIVTVEVGTAVETVKPNGAVVKVVKDGFDITPWLDLPAAGADGVIDMAEANVKQAVADESLAPAEGASFTVTDEGPVLTTAPTKPGLTYTLVEGETLETMSDGATTQGDGEAWTPALTVKDGASGFYRIKVGK